MKTSLERRAAATPRVSVKAGRAYWQPSKALRARGFTGSKLGPLTAEALNRADQLNEAADAAVSDAAAGAPAPDTVAAALDAYERSKDFAACAPRTRSDLKAHLTHARAAFGSMLCDQLTTARVIDWHDALGGGRTAYNHVMSLRTALAWAVRNQRTRGNPAARTGITRPSSHKRIGTRDELWAMVSAADRIGRPSVAVVAVLLAATMQRPADVRALTTDNVRAGVLHLTQFKTGAALSFMLHPVAADRLGHIGNNGAPLIVNERSGGAYSERELERAWCDVREEAAKASPTLTGSVPARDLDDPLHAGALCMSHMRRTGMVWAAEGGASIPEICSVSGHTLENGMKILEHYLPRQRLLADRAITRLNLHRAPSLEDMAQVLAA